MWWRVLRERSPVSPPIGTTVGRPPNRRILEQGQSELLFSFHCGTDHYRCEIRDIGTSGVEVRLLKNGTSVNSRGFVTRAAAMSWGFVERDAIVRNWGIW